MSISYESFKDDLDPSKKAVEDPKNPRIVQQWWKSEPGPDLANSVWSQIYQLVQADKPRIQQYNTHARLYGNQVNPMNNTGFTITTVNAGQSPSRDRIAYNLVQSCIDTLTSKISKNKPKPFFLTSKGDSKKQRKAKKLDEFCTGIFYENDAYARMPLAFRDACVWGEGIIYVYDFHGRVKWERVLPYELLADFLECHPGHDKAKTLHRIKNIDRSVLKGMFPKQAKLIETIQNTNDLLSSTTKSVSDTLTVAESWRLPSAPGGTDGLHCITIPGATLTWNDYKKDFFPFAIMRYSPRLHGFWGQGLAEQLTPIQVELNRCLMTVQRSFQLAGSFKVLLHSNSKVVKSHLDNTVGSIITWAGDQPPQYVTPPIVQAEIYQHIATLKQMGYEQSGISTLSATSQKQPGLNSGKAQREAVDIETDRFQTVGQAYEAFSLTLSRLSVSVAGDAYEEHGELNQKVPGKKFLSTIDWGDVDLEEDDYVMQIFPVSKLPSDPEGRLETIQEMMQGGLIQPDTGRRLLDYPDLDEEENLANAQLDYLHQILDSIVDDGKYIAPEPDDNLMAALKLGVEYLAVGKRDNLDHRRLDMLRDFIKEVNTLTQAGMPPPPPTVGAPQANPMPTPTSNIVPNVPTTPQ